MSCFVPANATFDNKSRSLLPGLDSVERKSLCCNGEETHQNQLAHALPTSDGQDPDLALIVGVWDRLPEGIVSPS